jgi:hypothetical protein
MPAPNNPAVRPEGRLADFMTNSRSSVMRY